MNSDKQYIIINDLIISQMSCQSSHEINHKKSVYLAHLNKHPNTPNTLVNSSYQIGYNECIGFTTMGIYLFGRDHYSGESFMWSYNLMTKHFIFLTH